MSEHHPWDTLSLISIQHELAMNISEHDRLLPMVRRVMSTCLRRLGIRRTRLFIRSDPDKPIPEGAIAGPGVSFCILMPWGNPDDLSQQTEIGAFIEEFFCSEKPRLVVSLLKNGNRNYHLFPLKDIGLITLEREGLPLPNELIDALVPVFDYLGKACRASREHERIIEEVELRRIAEKRIEYLAYHDDLTDLANRRDILTRMEEAARRTSSRQRYGVLLYLGLDNFSDINDSLGYGFGNAILKQVAARLRDHMSPRSLLARVEGDQFALCHPAVADTEEACRARAFALANSTMQAVETANCVEGRTVTVASSIGAVVFKRGAESPDTLLGQGRMALRRAKSLGRHTLHFYDSTYSTTVEQRLNLDMEMRNALEEEQYALFMQPQVGLSGELIGAEALIRWRHPSRGLIMPGDFIPTAEKSGFIVPMSRWVLKQACDLIKSLEQNGIFQATAHLAVNLSAKQFHQADFVNQLSKMLVHYDIAPGRLELELTEATLIDAVDETIDKIHQLKEMGVRFSIDDFGTGYSSLSYLRDLPLDKLKIDRTFVKEIHRSSENASVVEMIISIAKRFGFNVIAEGVETEEEFNLLKELGCKEFQGYLFGKPSPLDDLLNWKNSSDPKVSG
jgi:diguanylate cyclase (GGDEF)-like protein